MCGIAGLQLKNPDLYPRLGELVVPMLDVLASRGPDSTGVAVYRRDAPPGEQKYSLCAPEPGYDWAGYVSALEAAAGVVPVEFRPRGRDGVIVTSIGQDRGPELLAGIDPSVRLFGYGAAIEVYKDVGPAAEVCDRYGVAGMGGYQAIGHTRMATESAVTTEHSHPFAVSPDLALVHNGSFSNYASVRRQLAADGVRFDTDNDSEVAARYIAREMAAGADLTEALRGVMKVFDGFFTLLVAAEQSLAIVRDSFACKPMVVAETADYVAVASEYVALADLGWMYLPIVRDVRGHSVDRAAPADRLGERRLDRCFQALLLFSTAGLSWLLMMAVHEFGHVLQGWLSGAQLDAVHLPPFGFSRTDFAVNPHPLFVAWGGALWGCVLPLAILAAARCFAAKRRVFLLAWFAGFCLSPTALSAGRSDSDRRSRRRRRHPSTRRRTLATVSPSASSPWPPACISGTASAPISDFGQAADKSIARRPSA